MRVCPTCRLALPDGAGICPDCAPTVAPAEPGAAAALAAPLAAAPGRRVGAFVLRELLGGGGFADVWLADDERLLRPVALKLVRPRAGPAGWAAAALREARLLASLEHPRVVPVYDVGDWDGGTWIAMQHLAPGSLLGWVRSRGRLEPGAVADVVAQTGEALDAAHAIGLVHGDVKPANVLVAGVADGGRLQVKLGDFGLAVRLREPARRGLAGTPGYVAAERLRGEPPSPRSDLYALAVLAYELLAGRRPHAGASPDAVWDEVLRGRHPPASRHRPELGTAVDAVLARALAPEPRVRHRDCAELARELRLALPRAIAGASSAATRRPRIPGYDVGVALREVGGGTLHAGRRGDGRAVTVQVAVAAAAREALAREAGLIARLGHAAVLPVLEAGTRDGCAFLVRPALEDAVPIARLRDDGGLDLGTLLDVGAAAADLLARAHALGETGLRLDPRGVARRSDGSILLGCDGCRLASDPARERRSGAAAALAPEEVAGQPASAAADVYRLGLLLFEVASGQPPFGGSAYGAALRQTEATAPSLGTVAPAAPPGLVALVTDLLARTPQDRPDAAAARDVLAALRGVLRP